MTNTNTHAAQTLPHLPCPVCRGETIGDVVCTLHWFCLPRWFRDQVETPMETREAAEAGRDMFFARIDQVRSFSRNAARN